MKSLGERIRFLRVTNNLTQAQLGEIAGVKPSAVTQWEANRTKPSGSCITAIIEHFNIDYNFLLDRASAMRFIGSVESDTLITHRKIAVLTWQEVFDEKYLKTGDMMNLDRDNPKNYTLIDFYLESSVNTFAIKVNSDAMVTRDGPYSFHPGGHIVIDPDVIPSLTPEDKSHKNQEVFVVAKNKNIGSIVFRQLSLDGNQYYLKALNSNFPNLASYIPIGRVIEYIPPKLP